MFKKFNLKEDVSSNTTLKSSSQRTIRSKLSTQMPYLLHPIQQSSESNPIITNKTEANKTEDIQLTLLDLLCPKKESLNLLKCRDHVSILSCNGQLLFFQHFDGPYFPTLKILHKYPQLLPHVQVDRGAIKFVLAGANIMCPGLTSPGARLPNDLQDKIPVAVHAEGKESACAIGFTQMSGEDMKKINKGVGVDNVHWLGDDLWCIDKI
ncbi:PUA-like domain-containing protein [Melampsora americana]|nr:PUA-like domain-containing protein [Melampsora americana]